MTKKKKSNNNSHNKANGSGATEETSSGAPDKRESARKLEEKVKDEEDVSSESESSSSSSEEEDDDLVLEGVLVRNPDVPSSSSSSQDDDDDDDDDDDAQQDKTSKRKAPDKPSKAEKKKKKKKQAGSSKPLKKAARTEDDEDDSSNKSSSDSSDDDDDDDDDDLQVEFVFCDMAENYWDGLKSLLFNSSTLYQAHSSGLADLMIQNVSVGTVVSTEDNNADGTVFGFCSLVSISNNFDESPALQYLMDYAQKDCPSQYQAQLANVLSTPSSSSSNKKESNSSSKETKKKPVQTGFLLHGRMINLPLEIVHVLYQQVIQDWDWAVDNAEGGPEERESYNFNYIVRLAPCTKIPIAAAAAGGGAAASTGKKKKKNKSNTSADSRSTTATTSSSCNLIYRYFDDELLSARAELKFVIPAPKSYSKEEELWLEVIVLTRQGFRDAIQQDLHRLAAQN